MNRNNTERRAARECRVALSTLRAAHPLTATIEQARKEFDARVTLKAWRGLYPQGIPGSGDFHDGIPTE